ncbi:unnamed protein product [Lasius platythorax]|uniref:Uncharacterized protein n=1 Tax=Lasius platythorax TaxID=488582 RepID=A0AAV2NR48_9HYME
MVAVTEDAIHNTIGRPHVGICGFDGMIQGQADRNQCCDCDCALMSRVPRKHAKAARPIAHSRPDKAADASRCRKSMQSSTSDCPSIAVIYR